jgi:hypothetical protein
MKRKNKSVLAFFSHSSETFSLRQPCAMLLRPEHFARGLRHRSEGDFEAGMAAR